MEIAVDYGIHDRSGVEATQAVWRHRFADDPSCASDGCDGCASTRRAFAGSAAAAYV
jgi:hypothetical protein